MTKPTIILNKNETDEETEWEYEYSSAEFEDHYILLDLPKLTSQTTTSTVHPIYQLYVPPQPKRPGVSTRTPRKHKRRKRNKQTGELDPLSEDPDDDAPAEGAGEDDAVQALVAGLTDEDNLTTSTKEVLDEKSLQILDLHTKKPLISYRGTIYQCQWGTTLGTDMFFKKSMQIDEESRQQREGKWDLLGISGVRLVAREARITHRTQMEMEGTSTDRKIGDGNGQQREGGQHAGFLRRFVEMQVRKGEVVPAARLRGPFSSGAVQTATGQTEDGRMTEQEALRVMFAGPLATSKATREYNKVGRRKRTESAVETLIGGSREDNVGKGDVVVLPADELVG